MNRSDTSDQSDFFLLPAHGGYRKLYSFQMAEQVYDGTVIFCNRFIEKRSRTHDQMVQAARNGTLPGFVKGVGRHPHVLVWECRNCLEIVAWDTLNFF